MWIPFFFEERFNDSEELAGFLETLYEIGGLLGCISMGILCDVTGYRATVICSILWFMLPVMYVFNLSSPGATWFYTLLVFFAGFGTSGSSNFLSSVIPVDLAQSNKHAGEVLATIVGFIDGTGSFGAALGQTVVTIQ
jgi:OPA family glycerol-3-phosphate transporter-like MFS transporter 3